ncbi:MAG: uroporphyrinogen decarboxylase family protein [Syntrophales bacterium]|jgi:uroporphyrinogen decarboxylase|nr:uroporphyrinogen decarboxylase family protein [Syntrophales bacterium]
MKKETMTSMQRTLTSLGHDEPDRVPLFLLLTMHGARELGLSIQDYFSKAEHVAEAQSRMRAKYGHDCLYGFFYAPVEIEAWGGEVIFSPDGPPNSGEPFIKNADMIGRLKVPDITKTPCLTKVLKAIELMKTRVGDECPIIGVVMSPFSVPVMQMGFGPYLDLMVENPERFTELMRINEDFCVDWANAQLAAGATAICYFDPVSSPDMVPRDHFLRTGFKIAGRVLARINGPVATHLASGRALPILDDIVQTGAAVVGVSCVEDLARIKSACRGKIAVLGNLNGVEMRRWSAAEARQKVREAISQGATGGGFILSDNHGEIPWQVPEETLLGIGESLRRHGTYPVKGAPA